MPRTTERGPITGAEDWKLLPNDGTKFDMPKAIVVVGDGDLTLVNYDNGHELPLGAVTAAPLSPAAYRPTALKNTSTATVYGIY